MASVRHGFEEAGDVQESFIPRKLLILNGGQRRDRTADAGLFRAALYH
jgi:hypothetical protein